MKLKASMLIVLSTFSVSSYSQSESASISDSSVPVAELPGLSLIAVGTDEELPTVSTIDRDVIEKRGIQSWHDVSRRMEPGLEFNEQNSSINIRGLDRNRV